ncbi:ATP-binding cassette domain-containing protein [Saccharospirillum salsuginis]|uniref:Macrolide ABC transporter ATP-binding protein n=1 Tax=Saccharospirillum salsuginis TaxID=418750 RepID=A0A918K4H2_9GAMM|nr:ATP-binding cassette domain-containing protein [Saccharospirillum salsuginis]GGX48528.1 macrolide ABC transporter ATP-binding protein [Saccharospirillum salsuginis]
MTVESPQLIAANGLVKSFGRGQTQVRAVNQVSLRIGRGELVLIMGPSGSGKTTLLSMLGALLKPDQGTIAIDGQPLEQMSSRRIARFRARRMGFVFQAFNLMSALSARDNILFPARFGEGVSDTTRERADRLMDRLGLGHRRDALPAMLSGGEQQRVAIARALINDPPVILADEPTGNLDSARGQEVMMILHDIARDEGKSVLIVTHDPRVEEVADRVLWLEDGAIRDRPPQEYEWARDPVCGMRVDRQTATNRFLHQDREYVFCSSRCRERFIADPKHYVAAPDQYTL